MYQFTSDNKIVGYAIEPIYIKKLDNGRYGMCPYYEATGVVVAGTPYALSGKELDDLSIVEISKISDVDFLNYVVQANNALSVLGVETEKEEV